MNGWQVALAIVTGWAVIISWEAFRGWLWRRRWRTEPRSARVAEAIDPVLGKVYGEPHAIDPNAARRHRLDPDRRAARERHDIPQVQDGVLVMPLEPRPPWENNLIKFVRHRPAHRP